MTFEIKDVGGNEAVMSGDELAALDFMDAAADRWAESIELVNWVKNVAHIGRLNKSAPENIREGFVARQEAMIDALIRMAFTEGFYYGDENRANVERIKREEMGK